MTVCYLTKAVIDNIIIL